MTMIPSTHQASTSLPQSVAAGYQQRRGEMEVFRHGLKRAISVAKASIDLGACDQLTREAFITQFSTLELGLTLAGDEPAARALLGEYLNLQLMINKAVITQSMGF